MKQLLLICAVVVGQSVLAADKKPLIANPIVEKAIRESLEKPEGELTKAELQNLAGLRLGGTKITDAGLGFLSKMQQLTYLDLTATQITKSDVAKLKKALPKCKIGSNPTK